MEDRGEETEQRERERPSPSLPPPLQSQFAEILNFRRAGGRAGGRERRQTKHATGDAAVAAVAVVGRVIREGQEPLILRHVLTDKRAR